jgi:hypothetical protein
MCSGKIAHPSNIATDLKDERKYIIRVIQICQNSYPVLISNIVYLNSTQVLWFDHWFFSHFL